RCSEGGDPCAQGLACEPSNHRCCPTGGDCCETAADCPSKYSAGRGCVDPLRCWGSVETPVCTDNVCGSEFIASNTDASGCVGLECAPLSCSDGFQAPARTCD